MDYNSCDYYLSPFNNIQLNFSGILLFNIYTQMSNILHYV